MTTTHDPGPSVARHLYSPGPDGGPCLRCTGDRGDAMHLPDPEGKLEPGTIRICDATKVEGATVTAQADDAPPADTTPEADAGRAAARAAAAKIVADLRNRFTYHPPQPGQPELYMELRELALKFALRLATACPGSRELSLAWTHLETTVFWANAAIARQVSTASGPEVHAVSDRHTFAGQLGAPCKICSWGAEAEIHTPDEIQPARKTTEVGELSVGMARALPHLFRSKAGPGPGCADCGLLPDDPVHGVSMAAGAAS